MEGSLCTKDFKKQNSRWVAVSKKFPGVWLAEHAVGMLNMDDE